MYRILIVDDEQEVLAVRADFLREKGCTVDEAGDPETVLVLIKKYKYDGILLDVVMPQMGGFDLCNEIQHFSDAPVIFLSSQWDMKSQITGFRVGGTDYITKDCSLELFWIKVKTRIHIYREKNKNLILSFPPLVMDLKAHIVTINGEVVHLTSMEFNLLEILAERAKKVCDLDTIYTELWHRECNNDMDRQVVQNHISRMRRKIEKAFPNHDFIETIWRKGYRFVPMNEE